MIPMGKAIPLNGAETHPLSGFAFAALEQLAGDKPIPRQEFNAGIADRLERGGLVEQINWPSPYKKHRGGHIPHLRISEAGREAIAEKDKPKEKPTMAARKGNGKGMAARKPRAAKKTDENGEAARIGHNFKVNRRELKEAVDEICLLFDDMESARGEAMAGIKDAYGHFADQLGCTKKNLRKAVKKVRDAKKEQEAYAEMEPAEKNELDGLILALGSYADSPLGRAAQERMERTEAAEEMGEGKAGGLA